MTESPYLSFVGAACDWFQAIQTRPPATSLPSRFRPLVPREAWQSDHPKLPTLFPDLVCFQVFSKLTPQCRKNVGTGDPCGTSALFVDIRLIFYRPCDGTVVPTLRATTSCSVPKTGTTGPRQCRCFFSPSALTKPMCLRKLYRPVPIGPIFFQIFRGRILKSVK